MGNCQEKTGKKQSKTIAFLAILSTEPWKNVLKTGILQMSQAATYKKLTRQQPPRHSPRSKN